MKITIYHCDDNDWHAVFLDDKQVILNDYSVENVYRIADYLKWEIEEITLDGDSFSEKFA